jgi:scyllo-inositol 2-dehydrogenase (NADP+)
VTPAPVGVGLIGYGMSGSSLHAPLIAAEPGLALRCVVSGDPRRAHPDPAVRVVPTVAEMLADESVELVVVAAPNEVHHGIATAALSAGRHVVVDKPFTVTSAEADALISLAAAGDRRLAVFHQRRWDSDHLTIQRLVGSGALGEVSTYIARYDRFRPEVSGEWRERVGPGAGLLYDLGAHLIDQALHLFGVPTTITADLGAQRGGSVVDDYFHVVFGYGAMRAVLHAGSLVRAPGPRCEVHGTTGSYVTQGADGQIAALLAGGRPGDPGWGIEPPERHGLLSTAAGGLAVTGRVVPVTGAYESFYRAMAAAARGEGPVAVTGEEGRDTVRMIELARSSHDQGRTLRVR